MNPIHPITSDDLNAYIDGTLDPARRAEVDAALVDDAALRAEFRELRSLARVLADLPAYTPRRSFQLGAEHRRPTPVSAAPSWHLRVLPLVRQLSVAAALIFMVVAGAFFLDVNGNLGGDQDFSQIAVTDSTDGASQGAEDATGDDVLTERGDSASAGNEPMDDLTTVEPAGDDDLVAQAGTSTGTGGSATHADSDDDRSAWVWTSIGFGVLAVVLGGLWFALAQVGRQGRRS